MATKGFNFRNDFVSIIIDKLLSTISCSGGVGCTPTHKKPHPKSNIEPIKPSSNHRAGSEKLADLLNISDSLTVVVERRGKEKEDVDVVLMAEMKRKKERLEELTAAVRDLTVERGCGAEKVRRLAKEDVEARVTLGMLGAIPPLVAMISDVGVENGDLIQALYALLNLSIANDLNKAAIVQAGAVHNMLKKIDSSNGSLDPAVSEAIVANFLALSALDSNKPVIGASGAVPFLVGVLVDADKSCNYQARHDALRALYNLSILPSNVPLIIETDLIKFLISTLGNMEVSERILSILSNIVSTSEGRRAISHVPDSFPILIDVLNWSDSPGCQEKASYVLMVMAHKSYRDRQTMIEAGIGSTLLELTLLGSTLAQKRASRILECFSVDKGKQVSQSFNVGSNAAISAPIYGASSSASENMNKEDEGMMSVEKKAVKLLVQQSLQNNMKKIVKRANLPQDFVPSEHLKTLTISSTSKSLPF